MKFPIFGLCLFCLTISLGATAESQRYLVQDVVNVQIVGEVRQDRLSERMDGARDINGDGFDDIIVSTNQFSNLEPDRDNYAYLIYGASDLPRLIDQANTAASQTIICTTVGGIKGAGIGDFNGDGRDDLALANSSRAIGTLGSIGEVLILFGTGSLPHEMNFLDSVDGVRIRGSKRAEYFGIWIESAGDFNGDGLGDVALLSFYDYNNSKRAVTVIYGSTDFPSLLTTADLGSHGTVIHHAFKYDGFGNEFACAGDVNGDGFDDLLIGADADDDKPDRAYLIYGGTDLPPVIEASSLGKYGMVIEGGSNSYLGMVLAAAGDVNRDGLGDFLLSRSLATVDGNSKAGIAYIVFGDRNLPETIDVRSLGNRGITIQGVRTDEAVGVLFAGPGDWDGDQYPEIAIAPGVLHHEVYLMKGGPAYSTAQTIRVDQLERAILYYYDPIGSTFPRHFRFVGDVNGDGYDDLAVGDWFFDYLNRSSAGAVYIFYGGQFFPTATPTETPTITPTPQDTPTPTPTGTPTETPPPGSEMRGWILYGDGQVSVTPERE